MQLITNNYLVPQVFFLFEHFLPWIHQIMLAYQEQKEPENDLLIPQGFTFSKAYYTKKVN